MQNELNFRPYAESFARLDPSLDYSLGSLAILECLLRCLRQGIIENQVSADQMNQLVVGAGAYIGEILIQTAGGSWASCERENEPWIETPFERLFPFQLVRRTIWMETSEDLPRAVLCQIPGYRWLKSEVKNESRNR